MALVIDVMDVLYTKDIDIICLVSSDCDFTPLVTRSLADGKYGVNSGNVGTTNIPIPTIKGYFEITRYDSNSLICKIYDYLTKNEWTNSYNGSTWSGWVKLKTSGNTLNGVFATTAPPGAALREISFGKTFATPPSVTITIEGMYVDVLKGMVKYGTITTTGFTAYLHNSAAGTDTIKVHWTASEI